MGGIAVIGGAGFIGSHLVDELLTQGSEVTVLDNFSEGRQENLGRWKGHPKLTVVRGDIREYELVRRVCDGKFGVFHLAAMSRIQPSLADPLLAFSQNYLGSAHVAEACRQGGVKRIVYSASSSAYGRKNDEHCKARVARRLSCDEPEEILPATGLSEDLSTECLNPYSLSKKGGEEIFDLYNRLYGISTCSLRYFNVYGPRHQEEGSYATVIAIFRKQKRLGQPLTIVGDGQQRRDFTFVGDVVRANMLAMYNHEAVGLYNVGAGRNYSINELAAKIGGPTVHIPPRVGEANLTLSDCSKIRRELGWEPNIQLEQGLELLEAYERRFPPSGLIIPGVR